MIGLRRVAGVLWLSAGLAAGAAAAQDLPQLRAAMLASGTVNWEIATSKENGFDTQNGFELAVQDYADNAATRIALRGARPTWR